MDTPTGDVRSGTFFKTMLVMANHAHTWWHHMSPLGAHFRPAKDAVCVCVCVCSHWVQSTLFVSWAGPIAATPVPITPPVQCSWSSHDSGVCVVVLAEGMEGRQLLTDADRDRDIDGALI